MTESANKSEVACTRTQKPFPEYSTLYSIRGGGSVITHADVVNMNQHLLPRLPEDFRVVCENLINFGWDSLRDGTRWYMKKDANGHIVAAIMNDLRDHYTRFFSDVELLEELVEEGIDWAGADVIFFAACPAWQQPILARLSALHGWYTKIGFDIYVTIVLTDYNKFEQARRQQKRLDAHFIAEPLTYPSDSDVVNRTWTYSTKVSHITIGESVYSRPSICIRDPQRKGFTDEAPETDLINDLVGWEIVRSDFTLGSLKVLEAYRNQGLGKWLSTELTAKLLDVRPCPELAPFIPRPHPTPLAYVDCSNTVSLKLHEGLGYTTSLHLGWARYFRGGVVLPDDAV